MARRTHLFGVIALSWGLLAGAADNGEKTPRAPGYRGIWYMNQPQTGPYKYKYSGGLATYPQQHAPIALYSKAANKTFFCFGGKNAGANTLSNVVSYYDHATGEVPRPAVLLSRATNDLHYNPSLSIDAAGHLYVFANSHGQGVELSKTDPTHGKSFVFRSTKPYSIDAFEKVYESNFSYSQPWHVVGLGILWLHTRYEQGKRRLYFSTTDGRNWSDPRPLARIKSGNYQISWAHRDKVATALDHHPDKGGLNARTNIYYLQTTDFGKTWTTAGGQPLELPLIDTSNPALVHDFEKEKLLVYLKDLAFDIATGHPVILYLTAKGHASGPASGPRIWETLRWTGRAWVRRKCFESDHNYDHGSLYLEPNGTWRIVAPTDPGPQPYTTGGQIAVHISRDQGATWQKIKTLAPQNNRNQTYVRRPWQAQDDFYALWADGDALNPSESDLYFADKSGNTFRLPTSMQTDFAKPEPLPAN